MITTIYTRLVKALLYLIFLFITLLPQAVSAQVIWSSPAGSAWLTGTNWTGGTPPSAGQTAEFDVNPTSATTGIGIDMAAASGAVSTGAIYLGPSRPNNLLIGNSSATTPGMLTLTGHTVSGTANVFLANFAANSAKLTIQPAQGTGASTLGLNLGSTAGNLLTGPGTAASIGNTISITTTVSGSGMLTFLGGGTWNATTATGNNGGLLKLGAANTFTGGLTTGSSDGTQSGITELDAANALSNTAGNNIVVNANSQLYLAAPAGSTFATDNMILSLNGLGNGYTVTGKGALVNLSGNSYTWTGAVALPTNASVSVLGTTTAAITLSGSISGSGTLIKEGSGTLALTGAGNTWTGGTQLNRGNITVAAGSSLSNGPLLMNGLGYTVLTLNNTAQSISSLSSSFGITSGNLIQTISLAAGTTLTIDQSSNTTFGNGAVNTLTSAISGSGSVIKAGAGTLTLTSFNSFTGGLTISGGQVHFMPPGSTTLNAPVTLNGGTLGTSGIGNYNLTFGTVQLTDNSTIDADTASTYVLKFAASNAIAWTPGKMLTITHWSGTYSGATGTRCKIFVGTTASGLTSAQLAQIVFDDGLGHIFTAMQLSNGEIVPVAPVIATANAGFGPFCNNLSYPISVAFTASGPFNGTYKVQLSSPTGVFTADTTTGIIGAGTTSPIVATIPAGTAAGTAYRLRVINTSPITFGSNNGNNITVSGIPVLAAITGPAALITGSSVTLSNSTAGGTWTSSNNSIATVSTTGVVLGVALGSATITYTYTNSCGFTSYVTKVETVLPIPQLTSVSPHTGIPGDTVTITGANFNTSLTGNVIYFGAVQAPVISATSSSIKVIEPINSTYGPISVTDTALGIATYDYLPFLPTYNNTGLVTGAFNFKQEVDFPTAGSPVGIYLADLDGDGKTDMVVANSGPNSLYVYRNIGLGTGITAASFAPATVYTTNGGPHYIKIADIDGDGKPEILVTNTSATSSNIAIFRNTSVPGVISFAAKVNVAAGGSGPYDISVTDIDGDGKADLLVSNSGSLYFAAIKNKSYKGTISFASAVTYLVSASPVRIYSGDLDGDGKADVVTANILASTISLFRNTASTGVINAATFATPQTISSASCSSVTAADMDGDGKADLIITNGTDNTLVIMRNTSVPGTLSFAAGVTFPTSTPQEDVTISDIDGDGKPDIITGNYGAPTISIFRNTATPGTINAASLAAGVDFASGGAPAGIAAGDLDGDKKPDIAIVNNNTAVLSVLRNYPLPPNGTISGIDSICAGSATLLHDTATGGTWSSSNPAIATVSSTGLATGIAPGIDTIIYFKTAQGDSNIARHIITVEVFHQVGTITAPFNTACVGASIPLTDTAAHGVWASNNSAIASVDTAGNVIAHVIGSAIITYSISNTCGSSADTIAVNVITASGYTAGAVTGPATLCIASPASFTDTSANGTWSSSNTAVATVSAAGSVTGTGYGSATISYSIASTCGNYIAATTVSVDTPVNAGMISGTDSVCPGATITLTAPHTGGVWSASNGFASVASGIVSGIAAGYDTISVTFSNTCGTVATSKVIAIDPLPVAGNITGLSSVCPAATITLTDSVTGGIWGRTNAKANVSAAGVVTGVTAGTDTVYYAVTNSCGTALTTKEVTITPLAHAGAIGGAGAVCVGSSITLSDTSLVGVWSTTNATASIADSIITGVTPGTDTVRFTVTNVCGSNTATKVIIVNPSLLNPGTIAGLNSVCVHDTIYLSDTVTGGVWGKTNSTASVSSTGMVIGLSAGTDTIKYSVSNVCGAAVATYPVTIRPLPAPGVIKGLAAVCPGAAIILSDTSQGGVWTVTNGNGSFTADSVFTGITAGTDSVLYTVTNSCGSATAVKKITISPLPHASVITGPATVLVGDIITLKDSTAGGAWWSTNANAIMSSGSLGGLQPGMDTIGYAVTNSCGHDTAYAYIQIVAENAPTITDFQVYPNPSSGSFTVNLLSPVNEKVTVLLANCVYQIIAVYEVTTNVATPISADLVPGEYLLSAISAAGWTTVKIVIRR